MIGKTHDKGQTYENIWSTSPNKQPRNLRGIFGFLCRK